ncbi:hypothetical protein MTO96_025090, partial [Rhipicephalus appendiculatus]
NWITKAVNALYLSNAISDVILIWSFYYQPLMPVKTNEHPMRRITNVFIVWNVMTSVLIWCGFSVQIINTYPTTTAHYQSRNATSGEEKEINATLERSRATAQEAPHILALFAFTAMAVIKASVLIIVYGSYVSNFPPNLSATTPESTTPSQACTGSQGDAIAAWNALLLAEPWFSDVDASGERIPRLERT